MAEVPEATPGSSGIDPAVIERLRGARFVAALTGAGVSAESGIPTFRDALTGLWARYRPEDLATPEAFARDPKLVWGWYAWRRDQVLRAAPNPAHFALARLERLVPHFTLVTQNVDGLHQRAGTSLVHELHGNLLRARCSREGRLMEGWTAGPDDPPACPHCRAPLRPDVVWFGEALPADALTAAWEAARRCDVLLSVGTSNLVTPAASLPWLAAEAGALVVVVNTTTVGQYSGPQIRQLVGPAGTILPALLRAAWPDADPAGP